MQQFDNVHRAWWIQALESLRVKQGLSKTSLEKRHIMGRSQYATMLRKTKYAPRMDVIDRLLVGMDCTWQDWGEAVAQVRLPIAQVPEKSVGRLLQFPPSR